LLLSLYISILCVCDSLFHPAWLIIQLICRRFNSKDSVWRESFLPNNLEKKQIEIANFTPVTKALESSFCISLCYRLIGRNLCRQKDFDSSGKQFAIWKELFQVQTIMLLWYYFIRFEEIGSRLFFLIANQGQPVLNYPCTFNL
jgi:hypothetical protein